MKYFILLIISFSSLADVTFRQAAQELFGQQTLLSASESWVKYTCHGPLSPKDIYPIIHGDVVSFHYPVEAGDHYYSIREIQEQDTLRFEKLARICTVRRFAQTNLEGWEGEWLSWNSAHWDSKIIKRSVVYKSKLCRAEGDPCMRTSQCCGNRTVASGGLSATINQSFTVDRLTCNQDTHTCE